MISAWISMIDLWADIFLAIWIYAIEPRAAIAPILMIILMMIYNWYTYFVVCKRNKIRIDCTLIYLFSKSWIWLEFPDAISFEWQLGLDVGNIILEDCSTFVFIIMINEPKILNVEGSIIVFAIALITSMISTIWVLIQYTNLYPCIKLVEPLNEVV
jgi:hypothetical protein